VRVVRYLAIAALIIASTAGCTVSRATAEASPSSSPSGSTPPPTSSRDWAHVDVTGTGPQTITVQVPSPQAKHLLISFGCTSGKGTITLVEDPSVFESGPCGGLADITDPFGGGYQMPLPGAQTLHFTVEVPADAKFRFRGYFSGQTGVER
jgi:hypothetical protein